jgi:hypothetical protein
MDVDLNYGATDLTILKLNYGMSVNLFINLNKQLFSQMLLSRSNGVLIPNADISNFVSRYVAGAQIVIT